MSSTVVNRLNPLARREPSASSNEEVAPERGFLIEHIGTVSIAIVLVLLLVGFGLASPVFFSQANWLATSQYGVEYLILGIGETFVIVAGGIDLSVGAVLGFSSMTAAVVMTSISPTGGDAGLTIPVGALVSVAVGAGCGLLNGLLITKVKLGAFITTLGTLGIWTGGIDLLHGGTEIANLPSALGGIGSTAYGGWFTIPVIVMAVLAVVLGVVLAKTRFGMNTYAIGSSEVAARRGGINVEGHMVAVYTLGGLLAGVAGFLVMARFSDASPLAGANDELDAIAATVIGGASLLGGRGSVAGTTIGTAIVSILVTGLVLINLSSFWQEVAVGVVLIGAITIDRVSRLART